LRGLEGSKITLENANDFFPSERKKGTGGLSQTAKMHAATGPASGGRKTLSKRGGRGDDRAPGNQIQKRGIADFSLVRADSGKKVGVVSAEVRGVTKKVS